MSQISAREKRLQLRAQLAQPEITFAPSCGDAITARLIESLGIPVALVALVFDVVGLRRFWLADHRYRRPMTGVYVAVMAMVTSLLVLDLVHLAG